jgi:transcriptional regulator with XRE-family HTH domain
MTEQLGAMLVRLRQRKRWTQLRVAEGLCAASGVTTITRNEVSRWERQERIPSVVWLRWLAAVLGVSAVELMAAAAMTRKKAGASASTATASTGTNGAKAVPAATSAQTAPAPRNGGDPLSRVTIEFEHRAMSVRLNATYDDPQRALSAIGAFRSMVADGRSARSRCSGRHTNTAPSRRKTPCSVRFPWRQT